MWLDCPVEETDERGWKKLGLEKRLGTRHADDLVILCRRGNAEAALHHLREIMGKLKLTVNESKTRICRVPEGEFDFHWWPRSGPASARICCRPPKRPWPSWPTRSPAAPAAKAKTRSRAP